MSDNGNALLKQQIKQTEQAVTSVAEIITDKENFSTPPALGSLPVPNPAKDDPVSEDGEEFDPSGKTSATDELQGVWLASLDSKTTELNACLQDIQKSLSALSENVEHLEAEARIKNAEADGKLADNALRKEMADRTYEFMVIWCFFIALIIATYVVTWKGQPPVEFMLGLLGTCTISIIGLVGFVVSGLFKAPSKKEEK